MAEFFSQITAITFAYMDGKVFAMSYHGAQKVVPNYNVMGLVKAALEAVCRYLAFELGPKKKRVYAISPGPPSRHAPLLD